MRAQAKSAEGCGATGSMTCKFFFGEKGKLYNSCQLEFAKMTEELTNNVIELLKKP